VLGDTEYPLDNACKQSENGKPSTREVERIGNVVRREGRDQGLGSSENDLANYCTLLSIRRGPSVGSMERMGLAMRNG